MYTLPSYSIIHKPNGKILLTDKAPQLIANDLQSPEKRESVIQMLQLQSLRTLDMSFNSGKESAHYTRDIANAEAIAKILPFCSSLEKLNLFSTGLEDEGLKLIAAALPNCHFLQHIILAGNFLQDEGALELAAVIPLCPALTKLDLSSNQIANQGALALVAAIPLCPALTKLNLSNNLLGSEAEEALAEAEKRLEQIYQSEDAKKVTGGAEGDEGNQSQEHEGASQEALETHGNDEISTTLVLGDSDI